jgi:Hemopexin
MSDYVDYFFKGTQYVCVHRADTGPGATDAGYPRPISEWGFPAPFSSGIDAALYSGSKTYFFKGTQYIRFARGVTDIGTLDTPTPRPISDWNWPATFSETTAGIDAALWSGKSAYFFKGKQYIRVTRTHDTDFGTTDAGYPAPISRWLFPTGFGTAGIKGALYSGIVNYFFDGPNYIRVSRGLQGPGYVDTAYPKSISAIWDWPAGFGATGIDAALYSGGPLVDPPPNLHCDENINYYLTDHQNPLLGLQIAIDFDENFVPEVYGFSFELQAFSPSGNSIGVQRYVISCRPRKSSC